MREGLGQMTAITCIDDLRQVARRRVPRAFFDYADRGSYAEETLRDLEAKRARDYVSPVELAMVNIALGDYDRAIDWMDKAYEERRGWMAYLNVHPVVDPLRNEPRFKVLVRKMGL